MPNISQFKNVFFDRDKVLKSLDKAVGKNMKKFGAYVRRSARSSIRNKKKSSPPGKPPRNVTGKLKDFIFFGYDQSKKTVIIGPAGFEDKPNRPPELLEHGGIVVRPKRRRGKGQEQITYTYGGNPFMVPARDKELPKFMESMKDSMR